MFLVAGEGRRRDKRRRRFRVVVLKMGHIVRFSVNDIMGQFKFKKMSWANLSLKKISSADYIAFK